MMIIIFVGHCAAFNFAVWLIWRIWRAKIYCSLLVRSRDYSDYVVAIISPLCLPNPALHCITTEFPAPSFTNFISIAGNYDIHKSHCHCELVALSWQVIMYHICQTSPSMKFLYAQTNEIMIYAVTLTMPMNCESVSIFQHLVQR